MPRKPYSPFQTDPGNKMDYALARIDDLVNWGKKVGHREMFSHQLGRSPQHVLKSELFPIA